MYRFGALKWTDYLLLQNSLYATSGSEIAASNRNFGQVLSALEDAQFGTSSFENTVADGFEAVSDSLEGLSSKFEEGLWLIADVVTNQLEVLEKISDQLDAIHETLKSPLLTQARELIRLGQLHLKARLYPEALERFHQAENINSVDPVLQFQIGKLYLYATADGHSLVDLERAKHHLLLAERYAPSANSELLVGQIAYNLAQLFYVLASEAMHECYTRFPGGASVSFVRPYWERSQELLGLTVKHALAALENWRGFFHARYLLARAYTLTHQPEKARHELLVLIDIDRKYLRKAERDPSFSGIKLPSLDDVGTLEPDRSVGSGSLTGSGLGAA